MIVWPRSRRGDHARMRHARRVVPATLGRVILLGGSLLVTAGCGGAETTIIGQTAISVDESGKPVVVVAVCEKHINFIDIYFDREGLKETEENKMVGEWTSIETITSGVTLNVENPGPQWKPQAGVSIQADKRYIIGASATDEDLAATQVAFSGSDLRTMRSDSVYTNTDDPDSEKLIRQSRASFEADTCRDAS